MLDHEDLGVISTNIEPYINDPLVYDEDEEMEGEGDGLEKEGNKYGLALAMLEATFLWTESVENWSTFLAIDKSFIGIMGLLQDVVLLDQIVDAWLAP